MKVLFYLELSQGYLGLSLSISAILVYFCLSWSISVYFDLPHAISGYLRLFLAIFGYICLSIAIPGYLSLSQDISAYLWLSQAISGYLWLSQAFSGYLWLYPAILVYLGLSWAFPGFLRLFWAFSSWFLAISGYIWLYWAMSGNPYQVSRIRVQVEARESKLLPFENFSFLFFQHKQVIEELALLENTKEMSETPFCFKDDGHTLNLSYGQNQKTRWDLKIWWNWDTTRLDLPTYQ